MPMASVLRVTRDRREVRNRMTPTYPAVSSRTRISPGQGRPPGRPAGHPAAALRASLSLGDAEDVHVRGPRRRQVGEHLDDGRGPASGPGPPRSRGPAGTGAARLRLAGPKNRRASSGSPASSSTVAITWNWPPPRGRPSAAARPPRPRPRRPPRTAPRLASRRGISASRASIHTPPARQASRGQSRRHLVRLGPDRREPVPPPGGQQPRRPAPGRGHHPGQLAHGITPPHRPTSSRHRARCGRRRLRTRGFSATRPRARPRGRRLLRGPFGRAGQRPRRAGQPGGGQPVQVPPRSASAPARPASTPRPGPGRPAGSRSGTACPDFSPVCLASAYPCCHCDGSLAQAPPARTEFARRTRNVTPRGQLYIGRPPITSYRRRAGDHPHGEELGAAAVGVARAPREPRAPGARPPCP